MPPNRNKTYQLSLRLTPADAQALVECIARLEVPVSRTEYIAHLIRQAHKKIA